MQERRAKRLAEKGEVTITIVAGGKKYPMGKVKWIKIVCEDENYDAGVEFVNTPKEAVQKRSGYIAWKQNLKSN